jgi:hypothetical protein
MGASVPTVFATLEQRASALHNLVDGSTHPQVILPIQRAYASLSTCAQMLLEVEAAAATYVQQKIQPTVSGASQPAGALAIGSFAVAYMGFQALVDSAELISNERDGEVIKQLGWRAASVGAQLLAKLSGVSYVKDAAEIAAAFQEAIATGQTVKLRRSQARMATDLLNWIDAVTAVGLAWCYGAQLFLLGAAGQGSVSDSVVTDLVLQRMAQRSQTWH